MDYRIEKRDAFKVIAKRARYEGGGEISQQNIHATWEKCQEDGTIKKLCKYVNPESIFGNAIIGICFDNPDEGDFDYAIGTAYSGGMCIEVYPSNEVYCNDFKCEIWLSVVEK